MRRTVEPIRQLEGRGRGKARRAGLAVCAAGLTLVLAACGKAKCSIEGSWELSSLTVGGAALSAETADSSLGNGERSTLEVKDDGSYTSSLLGEESSGKATEADGLVDLDGLAGGSTASLDSDGSLTVRLPAEKLGASATARYVRAGDEDTGDASEETRNFEAEGGVEVSVESCRDGSGSFVATVECPEGTGPVRVQGTGSLSGDASVEAGVAKSFLLTSTGDGARGIAVRDGETGKQLGSWDL